MLYFRMLLQMLVGLYTSRIVLAALGVEDYGIYNIVGGIVGLFSFLHAAMSSATQRFLNVELGKGDMEQLNRVFNASITIHAGIALTVLLLAETLGLWIVTTQLNIPPERMQAVHWVYQFSVVNFLLIILNVPFLASIVAHERMSFFAYLGIIDVLLKLLVAFLLWSSHGDRLILYAALLSLSSLLMLILHALYCYRKFGYSRYRFFFDRQLHGALAGFSGWSLFGSMAMMGKNQGIDILLNLFYGVTVNAAMGITNQLAGALNRFMVNFQTAFNPQVVKSYAAGQREYLIDLVFDTAKYSYYLLLMIALPVLLNTDYILHLWLTEVPPYTADFCRLIIVSLLFDTTSGPLWMLVQATGRIRAYQITVGLILFMNLPFSYLLLKMGFPPYWVGGVNAAMAVVTVFARLWYCHKLADFPAMRFCREILLLTVGVTCLAAAVPLVVRLQMKDSLSEFLIVTVITVLCTAAAIYFVGFRERDRRFLREMIARFKGRVKR